ncbi:MAG TPA: cyanophycin synthetase, partial [Chitinophagaceae bacterium]|nr:cyanophycin synthetase [Chitinophagaceae bacterium]
DDAMVKMALASVMKLTGIQGRFQQVHLKPTVILDVSHNEAGIKACMRQVAQMAFQRLYIIMGFVRDKDVTTVLKLFPQEARYLFTQAQIPRALPYEELQQMATENGLQGQGFSSMTEALQSAMAQAQEDDLILVTGSFFIVDDAFRFFESCKK